MGVTTKAITLHAGEYNNKPPLIVSQGDGVPPSTTNSLQNGQVLTLTNSDPSVSKDDPAFVGMAFRNLGSTPASMGTFGLRQTYNGEASTAEGDFVFYVRDSERDGGRPPKEVLSVSNDDIRANPDYEPQTEDSLVTKGYVTNAGGGMGTLPIYSDNGRARVDYLDFYDDADKLSLIRLVNADGIENDGVTAAGSLAMDGNGRIVTQAVASSTAQPITNAAVATYAITTNASASRIGYSNRSKHVGNPNDLDENGRQQVSYVYGFYSQPQLNNLKAVTTVDFNAIGPQDIGEGKVQNAIGFFVQSGFASQADHPTGGPPLKYGFRSDIAQEDNKNQYAFFANGSAPSRFNSDIQLTSNAVITSTADMQGSLAFGAQVTQRSDYYHNFKAANPARGINNIRIFDSVDDTDGFFSITNYCSNYASGSIFAVGPFGSAIVNTKGHIAINPQGADKEIRLGCGTISSDGQELTIAPGDIRAKAGWTPPTDQSLATKAYVDANAGGGGGTSGVNKIIAGTNITVSPLDGTGNVTVNAVVPDVGVTKIIGGTNVTVTPADGTGTVTINATSSGGGADSLVDLDDVVITDPKGNEVLTYDITTGKWINKAPPSGGGGGGIIDGGQVPGTGSTFIWHDTKYSYVRTMDGESVGGYYIPEQPKDMFAYDGVFLTGLSGLLMESI